MKHLTMACLLWLTCIFDAQAAVSISGVDEQAKNNILAYLQLDDEALSLIHISEPTRPTT